MPPYPFSTCETRVMLMALSDDDQRRFDEIERALLEQDPVFAKTMTIDHLRRRRLRARAAWFCIGVLLLVSGLIWTQLSLTGGVAISVAGFITMVGATFHRTGMPRRR